MKEIIKTLEEAIIDVQHDLKSDWIDDIDKTEMQLQLQHLIIAKANLEIIAKEPNSQIFKSCITF